MDDLTTFGARVLVIAASPFLWLVVLSVLLWLGRKALPDRAGRVIFGHFWRKGEAGYELPKWTYAPITGFIFAFILFMASRNEPEMWLIIAFTFLAVTIAFYIGQGILWCIAWAFRRIASFIRHSKQLRKRPLNRIEEQRTRNRIG